MYNLLYQTVLIFPNIYIIYKNNWNILVRDVTDILVLADFEPEIHKDF